MIEFKCQHCGKGLHLNDSYAGRDGWCRVCKRMVIVPGGGPIQRVEDLPPDEGYERLQRLLQYAATKADKYKVHLARQAKEQEQTAALVASLEAAQRAIAEGEAARERLRGEYASLAAELRDKEALLKTLEAQSGDKADGLSEGADLEISALRADLALERESRESLATALAERDSALGALEAEVSALRDLATEHRRLEETSAAERVNLRALEGAVHSLKAQLGQAELERDRLASIIEEGSSGENDSALQLLQKDREIGTLEAALTELRAERDESDRATRDQIAALESQVLLFDEIKGRMGALQSRIKELEQERLDTSLALDSARQSETLLNKKVNALEASIQSALTQQSERGLQAERLQRELDVRDEQIKQLTESLQKLTEEHGNVALTLEQRARSEKSAALRADRLAQEIEAIQSIQDTTRAENDGLRRSVAELEARITSLNESLELARADAQEKAAHKPAAAALQTELSAVRLKLQQAEENGAAERASLGHTIAELQAEVMNLTQSLHREEERASAAVSQLEQRDEIISLHQSDEGRNAEALRESRARIEALEAALAEAQSANARGHAAEAAGDDPDDDDGDDDSADFILLGPDPGGSAVASPTVVAADGVDERRRQLEKKQMMDALSDFLSK